MNESYEPARRTSDTVINYRLWVNDARTILVRIWDDGTLEVCQRPAPWHTWEPPVTLAEEQL